MAPVACRLAKALSRFCASCSASSRTSPGASTANSPPRIRVTRFWVSGYLAHSRDNCSPTAFSNCIGALTAQTLVQPGQILDPQQQQITGTGLLRIAHPGVQLHFEITPVGQAGQVVLIGLGPQFFTAFGLLLEQRLELLDHLVHGLHHPAQFRRARQLRQAEEFAASNGVGLLDHVIQRLQLPAQQQRAQHRAHRAADQQPAEAAQRALPQLGQREHRVADHLDPRGLLPATADERITTGRFQADQFDEPVRHVVDRRNAAALDDGLVVWPDRPRGCSRNNRCRRSN